MAISARGRRIIRILVGLAVVLAVLAGGLYTLRSHRRQTAIREALAAGTAAYEARQYTQAAVDLGRYIAFDHTNIDVLLKYADAQLRRRPRTEGSVQQAVGAYESILRIRRDHPEAADRLTDLYVAMGLPRESERIARAWLDADPQSVQARQKLAFSLIQQEKTDEAVTLLEAILQSDPGHIEAAGTLAFLKMAKDATQADEAAQLLDAAVEAHPDSALARLLRARFRIGTGRYRDGRDDLEAAKNLVVEDYETLLGLGQAFLRIGLYEQASTLFDRAEQMAPDKPELYLLRGQVILDVEDTAADAQLADRALQAPLGEQRLDVLPVAAELYVRANRLDDARQCIQELKAAQAPTETLLYLDGLAQLAEGKVYEGIVSLEEAIRRNPEQPRPYLALGRAYARSGQLERAAAPYEDFLRRSQISREQAQLELARVYVAMGRWEEAARTIREAEAQAPYNSAVVLGSIEIQAMIARPGGGMPDPRLLQDLLARTKRLCEQVPEDLRLQLLLAQLSVWTGRRDEAVALLRALAEQPQRAAANALLVDLYVEAGEYEQAIACCQALLAVAQPDQVAAIRAKMAGLHLRQGQTQEADRLAGEIASLPPGSARSDALVQMARLWLQKGDTQQAREWLLQVAQSDPNDVSSRILLLSIPAEDADDAGRQALVDDLKRIQGEGGLAWRIWQARLWLNAPQWQAKRSQTESLLKTCLEKDPKSRDAIVLLAWLHDKAGEVPQALTQYRRAYELNPKDTQVARRYLEMATRQQQWAEVDRLLEALPADDASLQPLRIAQAIRRGDVGRAEELLAEKLKADPADYRSRLQMAGLALSQGRAAEADRLLTEAAAIAPEAPEVLAARVQYHLGRSQGQQAIAVCDQALARQATGEAYLLRAAAHEAMGDLAKAEADLRQAIAMPDWAERGHLALGELLRRHDRREEGIQVWREGLRAMPESGSIRRALAAALLSGTPQERAEGDRLLADLLAESPEDAGLLMLQAQDRERTDRAQAQVLYETITRLHPTASGAFLRLAQLMAEAGQMDRAVAVVEAGLQGSPRNLDLLLLKAELLQRSSPGRAALAVQEVVRAARQRLDAQPNDEAATLALARAHVMVGQTDQAAQTLQAFLAMEEGPRSLDALLARARLHLAAQSPEEADAVIQEAARLAPDDARVAALRVTCDARRQQWDAVLATAAQFSQAHPQDTAVLQVAARELLAAPQPQQREQAAALLATAVERAPQNPELLNDLGMACLQAGRCAEAKSAFEKALQIEAGFLPAANNLAWLLSEEQDDPHAAAEVAAAFVQSGEDTPEFASMLDTWGVVQYRLGMRDGSQKNLEESRAALERCLRSTRIRSSTRAAATFHLARTMVAIDKPRGYLLLQDLLADPNKKKMLSPADLAEAEQLASQLRAEGQTAAPTAG